MPGADHATDWFDTTTGQIVVIDEPYGGNPGDAERAAWAKRHGWWLIKTSWPGMYFPYRCDMYVATDASTGYDAARLVAIINAMPPPLLAEDWTGESIAGWDTFVSPMAKTPQDARRARCRGTIYPTDSAATVPVSYAMGTRQRRPRGRLGIPGHSAIGASIKALLGSPSCPYPVRQRLNRIRSTLEDWLGGEIDPRELPDTEFFDVYYHDLPITDPLRERSASPEGMIEVLSEIRSGLTSAYPDCAPLRLLLNRIDMSSRLMRRQLDEDS